MCRAFHYISGMKNYYRFIACIALLAFCANAFAANDTVYEQRRNAYIDSSLANFSTFDITLQAYRGIPVDQPTLDTMLAQLPTDGTADFEIVQLVRILFLSTGQYDTTILPVLSKIPFWLTNGETLFDYWSENHMCQWISSDYLLHQKYNWPVDSRLNYRVKHYLQLKVQYGFYEFLSTDYAPYCLNGLLNLADFAQDAVIKNLAIQASQRLLKDLLMPTTNIGVCYPTAGRNYYGKYETPYNQNYNTLLWLMTGFGQQQTGAMPGGVVLASSSLPVDTVINSWVPHLDTTLIVGHTLDSGFIINDSLSPTDKVLFQWSSGAYFHPEVCQETAQLLTDSNLWNNPSFSMFSIFESTPPSQFPALSTQLSYASESSVICNDTVKIFKDNTVTLSSVQNFWPGKLGYEQIPCVANVGTTAVFTASGKIIANFENRKATNENNDLPYVKQQSNVALLMYRPDINLKVIGYNDPEVSLHWIDSAFSEVRNDSLWLLGRQGNGYVGVRRGCLDSVNTLRACQTRNGQTWVIMVGDSAMYGSFNNFETVIDSSKFEESWDYDTLTEQWTYQAQITVDTITIGYAWLGDTTLSDPTTEVQNITARDANFTVFPNPAQNTVSIDLSAFADQPITMRVVNMLGQDVYHETFTNTGTGIQTINTSKWVDGMYLIAIETQGAVLTKRLIKN